MTAPDEGRALGIDYGSRRVGVSISDPTRLIAQGAETLRNDGSLIERLCNIVTERGVSLVVVGMPYSPDGGKGAKAREVEEFISRLTEATPVKIETWDESFSSVRAHEVFLEAGMKRKRRREKARVDQMAARVLLQEYLDHNHHESSRGNGAPPRG
jgi:putative holliday junction resolvase